MYKEIHVMEDQRKFLQSKMSESENWENIFQHYYDNIPAYVYLKDTESNYIFINKKCEELFNIKREELAKRKYSDFDFFNAEMAEQLQKNDKLVMEAGKHLETEETGKPEGEQNVGLKVGYRFYLALKFPLLDSGGNTIGVCGFSHDITKQKQLEEKLKTTNKKLLEEINERKQAESDREKLIAELQKALEEIKNLQGIIPICMHCKKIRDDEGYWHRVETYIEKNSDAKFSHGICPSCLDEIHPGLSKKLLK